MGPDDKYFSPRDYFLNDIPLNQGGGEFGTCLYAMDNTTSKKFVLKRNSRNEEVKIQSIKAEAAMLSNLQHENIIRFFGAVLDTDPNNDKKCNMMIEYAEREYMQLSYVYVHVWWALNTISFM